MLNVKMKEECRKTKMRFIEDDEYEQKEYVKKSNVTTSKQIMKTRLNMINLKSNFKGSSIDQRCTACKKENETTEHVLRCEKYKKLINKDIQNYNIKTDNIENLKIISEYMNCIEGFKEKNNNQND